MSDARHIEPVPSPADELARLEHELATARQALRQDEALLAEEQAAVNAFRMHCRLKLDALVDEVLELRTEKQAQLTRLLLWQQAVELGRPYDADDPFWSGVEADFEADPEPEILGDGLSVGALLDALPHDRAAERRLYRELARKFHPDLAEGAIERAYATSMMATINAAYAAHDMQALYDLAGEADPQTVTALSQATSSLEARRLRQQIAKCKRRRRRVAQQFNLLRQENTAKLWQKAQTLGEDANWWGEIERLLRQEKERLLGEIERLKGEIAGCEAAQEAQK